MSKKKKINVAEGREEIKFSREVPTPPAPGFKSPFNSLEAWLFSICKTDQPQKSISEYCFLLFESPEEDLICLVGYNNYTEGDLDAVKVDFEPSNMFFPLSKDKFANLSRDQIREQLINDLVEFTNTSQFHNSFFSKAQAVTTSFGGDIWPRSME